MELKYNIYSIGTSSKIIQCVRRCVSAQSNDTCYAELMNECTIVWRGGGRLSHDWQRWVPPLATLGVNPIMTELLSAPHITNDWLHTEAK
jgi:hypothetical protein